MDNDRTLTQSMCNVTEPQSKRAHSEVTKSPASVENANYLTLLAELRSGLAACASASAKTDARVDSIETLCSSVNSKVEVVEAGVAEAAASAMKNSLTLDNLRGHVRKTCALIGGVS